MNTDNPSPSNSDEQKKSAEPTLIEVVFPHQQTIVFVAAIIVGLVLISAPTLLRPFFPVNGIQSNLILCIGAALILAAFGGQATVRVGGIIMAGAAAVALGLYIYLDYSSRDLVLQGTIKRFDFLTYNSIDITQKNQNPILGRLVQENKNLKRCHYDFAIFKQENDGSDLEISLTDKQSQREKLILVSAANFESAFGSHEMLEWRLQLREGKDGSESILTLIDKNGATIASEDDVATPRSAARSIPISSILINAAFADDEVDIDVPMMLNRLRSDDTATRRGARDALSQVRVASIPVIMDAWRRDPSNYQVRLGVCVALTQMLRDDKNRATAISATLTEDDLNLLLDAAGDPDRTVRIYAGEFLFDLGDPRTTKLAIPRAAATSDDNQRYNWLLVSQGGWQKLPAAEKAELATPMNQAKRNAGQRTLQLFDKLQM